MTKRQPFVDIFGRANPVKTRFRLDSVLQSTSNAAICHALERNCRTWSRSDPQSPLSLQRAPKRTQREGGLLLTKCRGEF